MAYMKAWITSKFGQIRPKTTELATNSISSLFSIAINPVHNKFVGNEDIMDNILDEFKFRPDRTTDYGVICP